MENKEERKGTEYQPTLAEEKLIEVLLNPDHRLKPIREKCTIAGVDHKVYYRAFAKPEFAEHVAALAKQVAASAVLPTVQAFAKEAERGSFQHGMAILDMAGAYSPKQKVEHTGSSGGPVQFIMTGLDTWRKEVEPED